jgi:hypothetical protein
MFTTNIVTFVNIHNYQYFLTKKFCKARTTPKIIYTLKREPKSRRGGEERRSD